MAQKPLDGTFFAALSETKSAIAAVSETTSPARNVHVPETMRTRKLRAFCEFARFKFAARIRNVARLLLRILVALSRLKPLETARLAARRWFKRLPFRFAFPLLHERNADKPLPFTRSAPVLVVFACLRPNAVLDAAVPYARFRLAAREILTLNARPRARTVATFLVAFSGQAAGNPPRFAAPAVSDIDARRPTLKCKPRLVFAPARPRI